MSYNDLMGKPGKRITPKIYYFDGDNKIILEKDDIISSKPHFEAKLLGTVMRGLDVELNKQLSNVPIFFENTVTYAQDSATKTIGPYYLKEKATYNADKKTYSHIFCDKFLNTMVDYIPIKITYPTTVINFFKQLCIECGFTTDITELPNGNKVMKRDIYDGIGFTYRDVFDDIGAATATLFGIVEAKIIKCTLGKSQVVINDDILKNQNIETKEHFGPINSIVLSRSGESDSIYKRDESLSNWNEIKIIDNQLMNENDRSDYLNDLYDALYGIEYDIFDFELVGYGGFDILQKIRIETGNNIYNSYVFNDIEEYTQGYKESIFTELPNETETDYKAADKTDKRINQTYIIVRKQEQKIEALVNTQEEHSEKITKLELDNSSIKQSVEHIETDIIPIAAASGTNIHLEDSSDKRLISLEVDGKSWQDVEPSQDNSVEIKSVGHSNLFDINRFIKEYNKISKTPSYKKDNLDFFSYDDAKTLKFMEGEFKENTRYIFKMKGYVDNYVDSNRSGFIFFYTDGTYNQEGAILESGDLAEAIFVTRADKTLDYIRLNSSGGKGFFAKEICLYEGIKNRPYVPFNKYGIAISITDDYNLFDSERWYREYRDTSTQFMQKNIENNIEYYNFNYNNARNYKFMEGEFKDNTQYTLKFKGRNRDIGTPSNCGLYFYYTDGKYTGIHITSDEETEYSLTSEAGKTVESIRINGYGGKRGLVRDIILYEGTENKEYKPYLEELTSIILDESLRGLVNKIHDVASLKNNRLCIERKINEWSLSPDLNWTLDSNTNEYCIEVNELNNFKNNITEAMSNYFVFKSEKKIGQFRINNNNLKFNYDDGVSGLDNFKSWLSNNDVKVVAELEESTIEDLGEIEMPSTFKNITNITTTDELEPNINIEYIRDTTLSNYVEGQFETEREIYDRKYSELEMTDEQIKSEVAENKSIIESDLKEISDKFDGYVPNDNFAELESKVTEIQTSTYTRTQIDEKLTDGSVTKLKSTMVTIDGNGQTIDKNDSPVKTNTDADGLKIIDKTGAEETNLLEAVYDKVTGETRVRGKNFVVEKYLVVGTYSRFEDYRTGTGVFGLGGKL